jgi:hypothetical protein
MIEMLSLLVLFFSDDGNAVLLAQPAAKIDQSAALAAKGLSGRVLKLEVLAASRTSSLHGARSMEVEATDKERQTTDS